MKTEVFTCDRCGKQMEKPRCLDFFHSTTTLNFESYEACAYSRDSSITEIKEKLQKIADDSSVQVSIDVDGSFHSRLHHYELCKDCKKKLMKFLKGGNVC